MNSNPEKLIVVQNWSVDNSIINKRSPSRLHDKITRHSQTTWHQSIPRTQKINTRSLALQLGSEGYPVLQFRSTTLRRMPIVDSIHSGATVRLTRPVAFKSWLSVDGHVLFVGYSLFLFPFDWLGFTFIIYLFMHCSLGPSWCLAFETVASGFWWFVGYVSFKARFATE